MKRLTSIVAALLLALTPAYADFGGSRLNGFDGVMSGFSASATCQVSASNLTTYTFNDNAIAGATVGAPVFIVVGVAGEDGLTNFSISSATIQGEAALEVRDSVSATTGSLVVSGFYVSATAGAAADKAYPTGGPDVTVTFSEAITSAAVCVWVVQNLADLVVDYGTSVFSTDSSSMTCLADPDEIGVAFGMSITQDTSVTTTWGALNEDEDTTTTEADFSNAAVGGMIANAGTVDWSGTGDAVCSSVMYTRG